MKKRLKINMRVQVQPQTRQEEREFYKALDHLLIEMVRRAIQQEVNRL